MPRKKYGSNGSCMNLFVYGTLLVPKIWEAVTRAPMPSSHPAELVGYSIFRIRNADYPGIVESTPLDSVPGLIVLEVPDFALRRLDAYEDSFYERRELIVKTKELGEAPAHAYCIRRTDAPTLLSNEPWTLAEFEATRLEHFWARTFGR